MGVYWILNYTPTCVLRVLHFNMQNMSYPIFENMFIFMEIILAHFLPKNKTKEKRNHQIFFLDL